MKIQNMIQKLNKLYPYLLAVLIIFLTASLSDYYMDKYHQEDFFDKENANALMGIGKFWE